MSQDTKKPAPKNRGGRPKAPKIAEVEGISRVDYFTGVVLNALLTNCGGRVLTERELDTIINYSKTTAEKIVK